MLYVIFVLTSVIMKMKCYINSGTHYVTKVLVVDDEQSIVTLLKYNLETAGYIVEGSLRW